MKRIYFINDWYARLPWYFKILLIAPMIMVFTADLFFSSSITDSLIFQIFILLLYSVLYGFILFQAYCKNAFVYGNHKDFSIRLNGKRTDLDAKFISEVSFDENQHLQIRRINRVDTFDLSPFRKRDQEK